MKNIFKKNQIIITALAIMIAIAGYLSFTNNDKPGENVALQTANPDLEELDIITEVDGSQLAQADVDGTDDTTTDDTAADDTTTDDTAAENVDDTDLDATADDNDETTPVETLDDDGDELGDISDEDILAAANDVTDTAELDLEDGVPGEAVLASTTIDPNFFISNRLEREQMRARNTTRYLEIIESPDVAETLKQETIAKMIELTDISEKENNTEIALEARGFDDALVSINDGRVDIVINTVSISDQQLAIIEEIVKSKTSIPVAKMTIVPTVLEE